MADARPEPAPQPEPCFEDEPQAVQAELALTRWLDVERGIYVVGDKSWSIDMQRFNFQFTGQRFYTITDGRLDGMLRK